MFILWRVAGGLGRPAFIGQEARYTMDRLPSSQGNTETRGTNKILFQQFLGSESIIFYSYQN